MSRWGRIAGVADLQGWRTLAEVARELGVTDRTLQRRLAEAGIRPARPGRTSMLSDADVTKLMRRAAGAVDRRNRGPYSMPNHTGLSGGWSHWHPIPPR
jgi:excisionase family DNA binding protein